MPHSRLKPLLVKKIPFDLHKKQGTPLCLTFVPNPFLNTSFSPFFCSYRGHSGLRCCMSRLLVGQSPNCPAPGASAWRIGLLETICCSVVR